MEPSELIPGPSIYLVTGRVQNMERKELILGTRRGLSYSCLRRGTDMEPAELTPAPIQDIDLEEHERGTAGTHPRYHPK